MERGTSHGGRGLEQSAVYACARSPAPQQVKPQCRTLHRKPLCDAHQGFQLLEDNSRLLACGYVLSGAMLHPCN